MRTIPCFLPLAGDHEPAAGWCHWSPCGLHGSVSHTSIHLLLLLLLLSPDLLESYNHRLLQAIHWVLCSPKVRPFALLFPGSPSREIISCCSGSPWTVREQYRAGPAFRNLILTCLLGQIKKLLSSAAGQRPLSSFCSCFCPVWLTDAVDRALLIHMGCGEKISTPHEMATDRG